MSTIGPTVSGDLASLANLIAREAEFIRTQKHDLTQVVSRHQVPVGSNSYVLNEASARTAQDVTEGDEIGLRKASTSGITLQPKPKASDAMIITRHGEATTAYTVIDNVGIMVDAILKAKNLAIVAQGKTFTASTGGSTTELDLDVVKDSRARLGRNNANASSLFMVTTYEGWLQLISSFEASGNILSDAAKDAAIRGVTSEASIGALLGFTPIVTNSVDDSVENWAMFFESRALAYGWLYEYETKIADHPLRFGTIAAMQSSYDAKKWIDRLGVYVELKKRVADPVS
jgi:hypothetical protein